MISKQSLVVTLGVILVLAGCATGGAGSRAGLALRSGDYLAAFRVLKADLATPGEPQRRALRQFNAEKGARAGLIARSSPARSMPQAPKRGAVRSGCAVSAA